MVKYFFAFIVFLILTMSMNTAMSDDHQNQTVNKMKKITIFNVEKNTFEEVDYVVKSKEEWREILTEEQFHVTQESATERPFTGDLLRNKEKGVYRCVVCGTDLFISQTKYDSQTGWPSFWRPVAEENIAVREDHSLLMKRVEVHCPRCGAHLGHVFDDGPPPTNKRYCINSAALHFQPTE